MDSTVETVCRAIDAFYTGGPDVQQAQLFLQQFQESTDSWTICDQIIRIHSNSLACYFASQTLRTKILKKFQQLPADQYEPLRNSLLQHLDRHGASAHDAQSEATATQLCLAIADLYIQVPTWNNWIFELLNQCQTLEGDRTIMTLTLLQVFPEEVEEIRGIGENRRNAIRNELANCELPMITFLNHVLEKFHTNADILKRVFKCLESNLQNQQMKTDHFAESPLISSIFHIIAAIDPQIPSCLHETATNCIVAALFRVEDVESHQKLAQVLHRGVISLVGAFQKAQQAEDFDRLQNIARIFVETVESFYVQIVNDANSDVNSVGSLACLDLLILVAGHHDWTLVEMTFNVWYRITEELFKYDDDQYIAKFRPYAEKLIECLYEHCKLDPDDVDEVPDENSEFGEFRLKAIEALRDVVFIVNSDRCFSMMHQKLIDCCQRPNASWEESESALFVMAAVVQNLLPESDAHMPDVLRLICSLPVQSPSALIATSLSLISDLNDWLELHTDLLEPVIKWMLQFALDPRFAYLVATGFDRITSKCPSQMAPLHSEFSNLIGLLQQTTTNGPKIEQAICALTRAISMIIVKMSPADAKIAMEQLCEPIIQNLVNATENTEPHAAHNNNNSSSNKENEGTGKGHKSLESWASLAARPILWVDRIGYIFKVFSDVWNPQRNGQHIEPVEWISVAQKFVDALLMTTRKFQTNSRLVEHTIRSARFIFRALGPQSLPFVEPVVNMMIETYPKHRHSCYLYLASVIVDEYGRMEEMRPGFAVMVDTLSRHTFQLFNESGPIHHPETVDDLFRLAQRFQARATSLFFQSEIAPQLVAAAVQNLRLDHNEANKSTTKFILELIYQLESAKRSGYSDPGVVIAENLINHHGPTIVTNSLLMSLFSVSGSVRRDMADLLLQCRRANPEKYQEWLMQAVGNLPNNPMKATPQQLTDFVNAVVKQKERHVVFDLTRDLAKLFV